MPVPKQSTTTSARARTDTHVALHFQADLFRLVKTSHGTTALPGTSVGSVPMFELELIPCRYGEAVAYCL